MKAGAAVCEPDSGGMILVACRCKKRACVCLHRGISPDPCAANLGARGSYTPLPARAPLPALDVVKRPLSIYFVVGAVVGAVAGGCPSTRVLRNVASMGCTDTEAIEL